MRTKALLATSLLLGLVPAAGPVWADGGAAAQEIDTQGGSMFMEEVEPPKGSAATNYKFTDPETERRKQLPAKIVPDLSNVGVQVDPSGNIIPLINQGAPPVRQPYRNLQVGTEWPGGIVPMYYPMPGYMPGYPYGTGGFNLRIGRFSIGAGPSWGYPYASPYGSPFGMPYGMPYGSPFANSLYSPFGMPFGMNPFSPMVPNNLTFPQPLANSPFLAPTLPRYGMLNPLMAPSSASFGLWLPSITQWQTTSTYTPMFMDPNSQVGPSTQNQ